MIFFFKKNFDFSKISTFSKIIIELVLNLPRYYGIEPFENPTTQPHQENLCKSHKENNLETFSKRKKKKIVKLALGKKKKNPKFSQIFC